MRQTCRSYYMLQPLQSRYAMLKPEVIRYGTADGTLLDSSAAFCSGDWRDSRLFVQYPNGLRVWVNGHPSQTWEVQDDDGESYELPPYGWLAIGSDAFRESSANIEGHRVDRVSTPEFVFLDGRRQWSSLDGIETAGSVAVRKSRQAEGLTVSTVEGVDRLMIVDVAREIDATSVQAAIQKLARASTIAVQAFDEQGKELGLVPTQRGDRGWELQPPATAVRLEAVAQ